MEQQSLLYEERFLDSYAGSIISDPATAIVELVANCWDAYATEVSILWPDEQSSRHFSITDNGHGMTRAEFQHIWRTIAYNRIAHQGGIAEPPSGTTGLPRRVFGKNGKGRFASFCFASEYIVTSRKDGEEFSFRVHRTPTAPLLLEPIHHIPSGVVGHGTTIQGAGEVASIRFSEEQARELIGSRFLANPSFTVCVNGRQITFKDIPDYLSVEDVLVEGVGTAKLLHIDTKRPDKNTKQHGIAWWVLDRAVGACCWSRSDYERVLDGRTSEAKRFTFIVQADFLNNQNAVLDDWSGFREESEAWRKTRETVQDRIRQVIARSTQGERDAKRHAVIERVGNAVNALSPVSRERIETFVSEVVDSCPGFGEQEIVQLATILVKLEKSRSRFGLLELLHKCEPNDYDNLHSILTQWTIGMAKLVLDEIQNRLKLIEELKTKLQIAGIDEVHELQPLFERGLWMFGAQFDSIEFTSNRGMTTVIRELFGDPSGKGSRNRPDFVALPDSSLGFYGRASYDEEYNEDGLEHVVVVDLKTTGLALGSKEKDQVWKYIKELKTKGYIRSGTRVDGFVLGDEIEVGEEEPTTHGGLVRINPMLYDTLLARAEKRLLNLHSRVREAPFLLEQRQELGHFVTPLPVTQGELLTSSVD